MTDTNLDRAAQMAGFDDWDAMEREAGPWTKDRVKDHAATLDELDAAKAELAAFKREVSDAAEEVTQRQGKLQCLLRFILPKPDPLVELSDTIGVHRISLEQALAKHGLKLERIEHE